MLPKERLAHLGHFWPSWWGGLAPSQPVWPESSGGGPLWVAAHGCGGSPAQAAPPCLGPGG